MQGKYRPIDDFFGQKLRP